MNEHNFKTTTITRPNESVVYKKYWTLTNMQRYQANKTVQKINRNSSLKSFYLRSQLYKTEKPRKSPKAVSPTSNLTQQNLEQNQKIITIIYLKHFIRLAHFNFVNLLKWWFIIKNILASPIAFKIVVSAVRFKYAYPHQRLKFSPSHHLINSPDTSSTLRFGLLQLRICIPLPHCFF